jgi:hypothetical protein
MSITLGQVTSGIGTGTNVATSATGGATQNGSTFLIGVVGPPTNNITGASDNKGNTYTPMAAQFDASSRQRWFRCENGSGGAGHTFTGTWSASTHCSVIALEMIPSGGFKVVLDQVAADASDNASPYSSNSIVTAIANAFLVGFLNGNSSSNPATHGTNTIESLPAAGWTIPAGSDITNGSTESTACFAVVAVASTGTQRASFTEGGANASLGVSFATFVEQALPATDPPIGDMSLMPQAIF